MFGNKCTLIQHNIKLTDNEAILSANMWNSDGGCFVLDVAGNVYCVSFLCEIQCSSDMPSALMFISNQLLKPIVQKRTINLNSLKWCLEL